LHFFLEQIVLVEEEDYVGGREPVVLQDSLEQAQALLDPVS